MDNFPDLRQRAEEMLKATSRTFFIPINLLPRGLKEAVTSAYLSMRAIDEIEDHRLLPAEIKVKLLTAVSRILRKPFRPSELVALLEPYREMLPQVSLRLADWFSLAPLPVVSRIMKATAEMAEGMAHWVSRKWRMENTADLDHYTYCVAGLVGLLLSDLWFWHDGTETDRHLSVSFGRGLQAVNILRNRAEDLERGADFFPSGWGLGEMFAYARRNLELGKAYMQDIQPGPIRTFCKIPLLLAYGTLDCLEAGRPKLSRAEVAELVRQASAPLHEW